MIFLLTFLALWLAFRLILKGPYDFEMGSITGAFNLLYQNYARFFWMIFITGLPAGTWMLDAHQNLAGKFLFISGIMALLFNGVLLIFYECWMVDRRQSKLSNYTANRYALVLALGFGATLFWLVGAFLTYMAVSGQ